MFWMIDYIENMQIMHFNCQIKIMTKKYYNQFIRLKPSIKNIEKKSD